MPLGIVNDNDFAAEINNLKPKSIPVTNSNNSLPLIIQPTISNPSTQSEDASGRAPEIIIKDLKHGRGNGNNEVPDSLRAIIAHSLINKEGTLEQIAEIYGVSQSSASAYKHDATSTDSYDDADEKLSKSNGIFKSKIIDRAGQNLMSALEHITKEKLAAAKVKDIAGIAKDMSSVVNNLTPKNDGITINDNKVVVYRPRLRQESEYEIIEINE